MHAARYSASRNIRNSATGLRNRVWHAKHPSSCSSSKTIFQLSDNSLHSRRSSASWLYKIAKPRREGIRKLNFQYLVQHITTLPTYQHRIPFLPSPFDTVNKVMSILCSDWQYGLCNTPGRHPNLMEEPGSQGRSVNGIAFSLILIGGFTHLSSTGL